MQLNARTAPRRVRHEISPPAIDACPRWHSSRRPHRACRSRDTDSGREIVAPAAHDHDYDHE
jgi:ribosomal protein L32